MKHHAKKYEFMKTGWMKKKYLSRIMKTMNHTKCVWNATVVYTFTKKCTEWHWKMHIKYQLSEMKCTSFDHLHPVHCLSVCTPTNGIFFYHHCVVCAMCVCPKDASVSIFSDKTMDVIYQSFGHCDIFMMNYL